MFSNTKRRDLLQGVDRYPFVTLAPQAMSRYTTGMSFIGTIRRISIAAQLAFALFFGIAVCGCAGFGFTSTRDTRFIDMDSNVLHVSYGEEKRTETLPNGLVCTFTGKVLLKMPDGGKIVLYQTLSSSGMRFVSKNKKYEFREKGVYCFLLKDAQVIFEGVYCRAN